MNYKLTDKIIRQSAIDTSIYFAGQKLVTSITELSFSKDNSYIVATVIGRENYLASLRFNNNGELIKYNCTCKTFIISDQGCKHIIAIMQRIKNDYIDALPTNKEYNNTPKDELYLDNIPMFSPISYNSANSPLIKLDINLEVYPSLNPDEICGDIDIKIGYDKLYIIKNLKDFLRSYLNNEEIYFGQTFSLTTNNRNFSSVDLDILNYIIHHYYTEKTLITLNTKNYFHMYNNPLSIFLGKKLRLTGKRLSTFLNILKYKTFSLTYNNKIYSNILINRDSLVFNTKLEQFKNDYIIHCDINEKYLNISHNFQYLIDKTNLNIIENNILTTPLINNLIKTLTYNKTNSLRIKYTDLFTIYQLVFKKFSDNNLFTNETDINFDNLNLVTKIYLDKYKNGIKAIVKFCYGDFIIEPISTNEIDSINIFRDIEVENTVLNMLYDLKFIKGKNFLIMNNIESIVCFLTEGIKSLKDLVSLYYSESFKSISIKKIKSINYNLSSNVNNSILTFEVLSEDIDLSELKKILASIKEKKKYYKLKNNTILSLESKSIQELNEMYEKLNLSKTDIIDNKFFVPVNRAMFINSFFNKHNINTIELDSHTNKLLNSIKDFSKENIDVPSTLKNILRDYQVTGFKWLTLLSKQKLGGILADDMGLGKTIQVLSFILSEKSTLSTPSIVVVPTSLVYNWFEECLKFTPQLKSTIIIGNKQDRKFLIKDINNYDLIITSYGSLKKDIQEYNNFKFKFCFIDEAQHIKNPNTLNASAVKKINASSYFAITGTPVENSISELWSIFDFLMPGYLSSHKNFVEKFEKPIIKLNSRQKLNELIDYIKPFILRRLKSDVLSELPPKIESKVVCYMESSQSKIYSAYLSRAKKELETKYSKEGISKNKLKILALLTRLRQICCDPALFIEDYEKTSGKLELLLEILDDALSSSHRVVIFSQFTSMLKIIQNNLNRLDIPHLYLDGSLTSQRRIELVNEFNAGKTNVFLISLKAGGTGLNLTTADTVIHYDPWWNPSIENQATDRTHRIGQTKTVQVYKLITKDSIEEKIYELQENKKDLIEKIIKPGETILSNLSDEDILKIFE